MENCFVEVVQEVAAVERAVGYLLGLEVLLGRLLVILVVQEKVLSLLAHVCDHVLKLLLVYLVFILVVELVILSVLPLLKKVIKSILFVLLVLSRALIFSQSIDLILVYFLDVRVRCVVHIRRSVDRPPLAIVPQQLELINGLRYHLEVILRLPLLTICILILIILFFLLLSHGLQPDRPLLQVVEMVGLRRLLPCRQGKELVGLRLIQRFIYRLDNQSRKCCVVITNLLQLPSQLCGYILYLLCGHPLI